MSQQYTSRTAALKATIIDAIKLRVKKKIGDSAYVNILDLIPSKEEVETTLGALKSKSNYIDTHGCLSKNVEDTITDLSTWLREQVSPLVSCQGYFNNIEIGSENAITRINFNLLREIISDSFIKNCIINGTVIIQFSALETINSNRNI